MFDTVYSQIAAAVAVVVVAFAFLKGDEPERVGAGAYMLGLLASVLVQNDSQLFGPQWGLLAIDMILLAVYAALAWKSRRSWPVWAGGLQALAVMSRLLTMIEARPPNAALPVLADLAGYGIVLALALGVRQAWRDARAAALATSRGDG